MFKSGIHVREVTYETFQQLTAERSDSEVKKSNGSHKHFIEALKEAYKVLGGESETTRRKADAGSPHEPHAVENNIIRLANRFASLYLGTANGEAQDDDGAVSDVADGPSAAAQRSQKKSSGLAKQGKRGKRSSQKPKQQNQSPKSLLLSRCRLKATALSRIRKVL